MSNLHPQKYPNIYLFSRLCDKPLERVSIRNARYYDEDAEDRDFLDQNSFNQDLFNQNMLLKFIRNAPSTLTWFRSDLSTK